MTATRQAIFDVASALSEEDRDWLIIMLQLTITNRDPAERDVAFEEELERRMIAFKEERVESKPWEEVRESVRKRVAQSVSR